MLVWISLRISIIVSSFVGNGLGSVVRLHSFKSVTRSFLSSKVFSIGSNVSLLLASCSSMNSSCSGLSCISVWSSPRFSSSSLCLCILYFAFANSNSKANPPSFRGSISEKLGCIFNIFSTLSGSLTSPTQVTSTESFSNLSNFSLSKMLRDA